MACFDLYTEVAKILCGFFFFWFFFLGETLYAFCDNRGFCDVCEVTFLPAQNWMFQQANASLVTHPEQVHKMSTTCQKFGFSYLFYDFSLILMAIYIYSDLRERNNE